MIITDARFARSHAIQLIGGRPLTAALGLSLLLTIVAACIYHLVFLKGVREGWPLVGSLARLVVKDEVEQRERFMRENLDGMARRLGNMQAKIVILESLGERVSSLHSASPPDMKTAPRRSSALVASPVLSMKELQSALTQFESVTDQRVDLLTVIESRLFDQKIRNSMIPTQEPVSGRPLGSAFGWRIDPITGASALHTGLDFRADTGTPILAAAGAVVIAKQVHPARGDMIEVDHGNDLVTRYAHASSVDVRQGDFVKRGQKIGEVGTSGCSTGPRLHFEVLVQHVPQDPQKFPPAGGQAHVSRIASSAVSGAGPPASATAPGQTARR